MNATDVIAYAIDAEIVCADCATRDEARDCSPAFCGEESDTPQHCARCECLIDGYTLTRDGRDYVAEKLADVNGRPEILAQWADLLDDSDPDDYQRAALALYRWRVALVPVLSGQSLTDIPGPLGDALRLADDLIVAAWDAARP